MDDEELPSAGTNTLWHLTRRFMRDVFSESGEGVLLHIGAHEGDVDLYERTAFSRIICVHHDRQQLERIQRSAPPHPPVSTCCLDIMRPDAIPVLLGCVAARNIACVMWRVTSTKTLREVARTLLVGLCDDCLVYLLLTDQLYAQQLIKQSVATGSGHTIFLPDGERRALPHLTVGEVSAAFERCGYRCIHREGGAALGARLGRNMLPVDRLCSDVQQFLAFSVPFRCRQQASHCAGGVAQRCVDAA